ncbi:MAG: hypothetical protein M3373_12900, partial [Gemmatimonadota bacterium]|nr:hypothetical protein [Gemmatimonadota bacterium]
MTHSRPLDVHVVSHTHWDREWYHPAGVFRQRLVALMDELLDAAATSHAEGDGSFLLDGQAILLEDYVAVRPDRRAELEARLRAGLLEAGPWYVLADELIPSGEALVRNLLAGRRVLASFGALAPPVLYSPDAFGHPAALPCLAAGFGCGVIIVWRGLGGERWPAGDTFRWRAPDGSSALVHHLPAGGYEYGASLPIEADAARTRWRQLRAVLAPRSRLGVLLVLNGADHHARQEGLDAALEALSQAALPDRVRRASLGGFASAVTGRATSADIPPIDGELRASYGHAWTLQGTFGTRAHLKRRNARIERFLLRDAEPWAALAVHAGSSSRRHFLNAAWTTLLRCHPHDTLCGCSIDEVARAMEARLDDAESQATALRDEALHRVAGHDPTAARTARERWRSVVLVRNPAPRPRGGVAELEVLTFRQIVPVGPGSGGVIPNYASPRPFTLAGGTIPFQLLERTVRYERIESPRHYPINQLVDVARVVALVPIVPGYGIRAIAVDEGEAAEPGRGVEVGQRWMRNAHLAVEVGDDGTVRLRVPVHGIEITSLLAFEDVGDAGDLYTPSPIEPRLTVERCNGVELVHRGPIRASLRLTYAIAVPIGSDRSGRSTATVSSSVVVTLTLDADASFLRIGVRGDNGARDHRLRVVLASGLGANTRVYADAAFGPVCREPIVVSPAASAVELTPPTAPLARYLTVAGESSGVTIYSDGLAEYEATEEGKVAITLVRAVGELSRNDLPERPGHAGWPAATPEAQCLGPFAAEFAVFPHGPRDDATIARIERTADDVLLPLTGATLGSAMTTPDLTHGVTLEGAGLAFSTC